MGERIPGHRVRPVGSAPGLVRLIGTRERDGARVAVTVAAQPVSPTDQAAWLRLRAPGTLPVTEFVDTEDGLAIIYADPPRHTLAELVERAPLPAAQVVYAVTTVLQGLRRISGAGLWHGDIGPDAVWVTHAGEVLLGDLGAAALESPDLGMAADSGRLERAPGSPAAAAAPDIPDSPAKAAAPDRPAMTATGQHPHSPSVPQAFAEVTPALAEPDPAWVTATGLGLAAALLCDLAPISTAVARLGLDAGDSQRRELAELVAGIQAAVDAGMSVSPAELRARLIDAAAPEPLDVPREWAREADDLAGRLRAMMASGQTEPRSTRPWAGARLRVPNPGTKRGATSAGSPRRPAASRAAEALSPSRHSVTYPAAPAPSPSPSRSNSPSPSTRATGVLSRWRSAAAQRAEAPAQSRRAASRAAPRTGQAAAPRRAGSPRPSLGPGRAGAAEVWAWISAAPQRYLPVMALALLLSGALAMLATGLAGSDAQPAAAAASARVADPPGGATHDIPSAAPSETEAVPGTQPPIATDPVADLSGPLTDPDGLAQALSDLRAQAWLDLDPAILDTLNVAGSTAAREDAAALARARRDRLSYAGLDFTIRSATSASVGAPDAKRVVLDAIVDTSAFTITRADGRTTRVAAASAAPVRMVLAWSGDRWQVAQVETS